MWLARTLGTSDFGVLEFANSLLAWFLLLADGGLELWATREAARTASVPALVARVVPLRFLLATASFVLLFLCLPALPGDEKLKIVMALFGLSLFAQAASLKWLFLGREQMGRIAAVLVAGQLGFALAVLAFIRKPEDLLWVPVLKFAADAGAALGFARLYRQEHGTLLLRYTFSGARLALGPAITMGATQAMGLLNFNFDTLLIGFLLGFTQVGLYNAAYKPVTMLLALPLTYFTGLFPALARAWHEGPDALKRLAARSLHLCALFAMPCGVGGTLLAPEIVALLFGEPYRESALPFSILVWSAVLVVLRGTYRHGLNAAGHQSLDLRSAVISSLLNAGLNILLVPRYGLVGAACATVAADVVWLGMAWWFFAQRITPLPMLASLWRPVLASAAMGALLWGAREIAWIPRAGLAAGAYFAVLFLLGERVRQFRSSPSAPASAEP